MGAAKKEEQLDKKTQIEQSIRECQTSKRILANATRLLKEASFPGSVASQVHEAFGFFDYLVRGLDAQIDQYQQERKDALKEEPKKDEAKNESAA